jgi:uncharacterized protein (DUF1778 family)
MARVTHVTIELLSTPHIGETQMLVRCAAVDKALIDKAADSLGMATSVFTRMVLVQTAKQVMEELKNG